MASYYNEFDPNAAAWLRELIAKGLIAPGDVDTRSIVDVRPDDLRGYTQAHFFAGIGVWSHALRLAGWADDRPIWTGSCPCQPFSAAGKGGGFDDERHLWPAFHHLIEQCRPDIVVGEQVASKDGLAWLDLVHADLEGTGYAVGAADTCAAGFGAPHIRQRLWWVGEKLEYAARDGRLERRAEPVGRSAAGGCGSEQLGHADDAGLEVGRSGPDELVGSQGREAAERPAGLPGMGCGLADAVGERVRSCGSRGADGAPGEVQGCERKREWVRSDAGAVDDCVLRVSGPNPAHPDADLAPSPAHPDRLADDDRDGAQQTLPGLHLGRPQSDGGSVRTGPTNGFWAAPDWLQCRDGKWRAVEPCTFPLAHGSAARVGRLRGYGNAIVAQAAEGFIASVMEAVANPAPARGEQIAAHVRAYEDEIGVWE